jgi:hypothetical protein
MSLVTFRSKSVRFEEGKMEKPAILDPSTVWETSTVTEEQIQSLVNHGLLRPKSQVGWRSAAGEAFPTEGTGETVFGIPAGDFLRIWHPTRSQSYRRSSISARPSSASLLTSTSGATSLS